MTLPAVKRGQGVATGGMGVGELLVVVAVCARTLVGTKTRTTRPITMVQFTRDISRWFIGLLRVLLSQEIWAGLSVANVK